MPTLTYVVYANFRDIDGAFVDHERVPNADPSLHEAVFAYIRANGIPGLYERHSDGSGTTHVSHLRPILNMRPKFRYRVWAAPSRFPADLYLIDWLEATGHQFDVITDHDLHAEGADLLAPYNVILTGSHPEYWTAEMLAGMRTYLDQGGRLMYLGGNGFFGVTTIDAERPTSPRSAAGAPAGPSRCRPPSASTAPPANPAASGATAASPPMASLASAPAAAGFDRGSHYVRQPDSFDPRAAFIFEGIGDDEPIGDVPSLVVRHGAAGYEMDRLDFSLGTPPHALLLASSVGHSERYTAFNDERLDFTQGKDGMLPDSPPPADGPHAFVRADLVYFETPNGGGRLLRRLHRLARLPLPQQLRQHSLPRHRQRPPPLRLRPMTPPPLYNGIHPPAEWPPRTIRPGGDPLPVPYLANPPRVIPIDVGRQLFVDDFLIEHTTLRRVYHAAKSPRSRAGPIARNRPRTQSGPLPGRRAVQRRRLVRPRRPDL